MSKPVVQRQPWWLPLIVVVAGAATTVEGLRLPLGQDYAQLGPGFLVLVVGIALVGLGIATAWQLWSGVRYEPEEVEGVDLGGPVSRAGLMSALLAITFPIFTIPWLGFPLAASLAYALVARAFGSGSAAKDAAIGLIVSAVTWFAFTRLGVDLGPLLPVLPFGGR